MKLRSVYVFLAQVVANNSPGIVALTELIVYSLHVQAKYVCGKWKAIDSVAYGEKFGGHVSIIIQWKTTTEFSAQQACQPSEYLFPISVRCQSLATLNVINSKIETKLDNCRKRIEDFVAEIDPIKNTYF